MLLNVGNLAKTYGLLPSQVLANATTFDLMVTDVLVTWENHKQNPNDVDQYKTEDLQKMLEKTKKG